MSDPKLTPEEQARIVNAILSDFARELGSALRANLRARAGNVPSGALQNLAIRLVAAKAGGIEAAVRLEFQDPERIVDMRKLLPGSPTNLDAIWGWVRKRGVQSFRYVPGYDRSSPSRLTEAQQVKRIGTAIAFSRAKGVRKTPTQYRKSHWLNRTFYGFFNRLIGDFQTRQADYLQLAMKGELEEVYSELAKSLS